MSLAKRKQPVLLHEISPKRPRSSTPPLSPSPDAVLPLLQLGHQVHDLGVKVFAFRDKGLPYFTRVHQQRLLAKPEETSTPPTASNTEREELRLAMKERLAVANETLPTLLADLAMWNKKIQQAVDVMRKGQRLPFLESQEQDGI